MNTNDINIINIGIQVCIKTNDINFIDINIGSSFMYAETKNLNIKEIMINGILSIQDKKLTFEIQNRKRGSLILAICMWWLYVILIIIWYKCLYIDEIWKLWVSSRLPMSIGKLIWEFRNWWDLIVDNVCYIFLLGKIFGRSISRDGKIS